MSTELVQYLTNPVDVPKHVNTVDNGDRDDGDNRGNNDEKAKPRFKHRSVLDGGSTNRAADSSGTETLPSSPESSSPPIPTYSRPTLALNSARISKASSYYTDYDDFAILKVGGGFIAAY